ncbi:hypothetical protein [Brucella pseudogrignonensis]|uniref:hypothetical protein n=1 Tax=Brucella pseudogrignonensis TaxID=419475 RepID=UPI0038CF3420
MQTLDHLASDLVSETTSDTNSYGFRINYSTADAGEYLFSCRAKPNSVRWVLAHIPMNKQIFRKCLKAGVVFKDRPKTKLPVRRKEKLSLLPRQIWR